MKKTAFLKTAFLALAFCMAFVLIPSSNASVSANEMPSGHTCNGVTYDIPLDSTFTGGTLASGNYYLTEDIDITNTMEIAEGADVKICLNGKNIAGHSLMRNLGTLTLNNCNDKNGELNIHYYGYKTSVLYGNAVINGSASTLASRIPTSLICANSKISGCVFDDDVICDDSSMITDGTFNQKVEFLGNSTVLRV